MSDQSNTDAKGLGSDADEDCALLDGQRQAEDTPLLDEERQAEDTPIPDEATFKIRPVSRKITVEPLMILYFGAVAAMSPINQQFIFSEISKSYNISSSNDQHEACKNTSDVNNSRAQVEDIIQAETSHWIFIESIVTITPMLFSTLILGAYTDKAGRRIGILLPLTGFMIMTLLNIIISSLQLPFYFILIGSFISGVLGGATTLLTACFAYIADVTTLEKRSIRIVIVTISEAIGNAILQASIGFIIKYLGFNYSYLMTFIISVLCFLYSLLFIPETIVRRADARIFTMEHFKKPIRLYYKDDRNKRRIKILLITLITFLYMFVDGGSMLGVLTLYMYAPPLCFGSVELGIFISTNYVVRVIGAVLIVKLLSRYVRDTTFMIIGALSFLVYLILLSLSNDAALAFGATLTGCGSLLVISMGRSTASKIVEPSEQGALFAALSWLILLAALLGSTIFVSIYNFTMNKFRGGAFSFGAGFSLINTCLILMLHYYTGSYHGRKYTNYKTDYDTI